MIPTVVPVDILQRMTASCTGGLSLEHESRVKVRTDYRVKECTCIWWCVYVCLFYCLKRRWVTPGMEASLGTKRPLIFTVSINFDGSHVFEASLREL